MPDRVSQIDRPQIGSFAPGRELLALDAIARLNEQIASNPDFHGLVNLALLTISGQFAVGDVSIIINNPGSILGEPLLFGIGSYEDFPRQALQTIYEGLAEINVENRLVIGAEQVLTDSRLSPLRPLFDQNRIALVMPLRKRNITFGLLILGERIHPRNYSPNDLIVLNAILTSFSPFLFNLRKEYFDLFNSANQGVIIFNRDFKLRRINETGIKILSSCIPSGTTPDAIYRTTIHELLDPEFFPSWLEFLEGSPGKDWSVRIEDFAVQFAGERHIYRLHLSKIGKISDEKHDYMLILEDITELKKKEKKLFDMQFYAEMGLMVSSITHEMNNHLALILGVIELARRALDNKDIKRTTKYMERISDYFAGMESFVRSLNESRSGTGQRSPENLNSLINDIVSFIRIYKKASNVNMTLRLDPGIPQLELDKNQITQLLLNLLKNSADAIEAASRENGAIAIETKLVENSVYLTISDNGIGIKPEIKERLFKEQLTTKDTGHGFGLVVCSRILKDHGASFDVDSVYGQGATFKIGFPLKSAEIR
jgi:signal transduction histidine kinase